MLGLAAAAAILGGCASGPVRPAPGVGSAEAPVSQEAPGVTDERFTPYWLGQASNARARGATEIEHPFVPPAALQAAAAEQELLIAPSAERAFPTTKISLVMRDAQVPDVLRAMARAVDINLLVSPGVEGVTTVELRDAAWDEAFGGLLASLGLHHKWLGNVLRVMTADGLQKELEIEKLEKDRELTRHERRRVEPLVLQTIPIHYASAAKLQPILENLLSVLGDYETGTVARDQWRRRGSVVTDEENNALVVNALRDDLMKMVQVVRELDRPKSQVLIEAKIIVANRETARELGFQWGGVYKGGRSYIFPGTSSSSVLGGDVNTAIAPISGNFSNFPSGSFSGTTSTDGTTGTAVDSTSVVGASGLSLGYAYQNLGDYILTTQLTALETAGKAQIIATPSITTLDNVEATLKSGYEIPYQSYSQEQGSEVQFKEALLELTVTPHVIGGRMVKIRLVASNDEPDYSRVDSGVTSEPAISRQSAETSLLLYHGETTVIGGLSRTYGNDSVSGVPLLKDVPGIGRLFRSNATEKREEDMLIFITPYILGERETTKKPAASGGGEEAPEGTTETQDP